MDKRPRSNARIWRIDPPYRIDLINAAMGAKRLTNETLAEKAGVGPPTVYRVRNGYPHVGFMTLKKVVEALGLTMAEVTTPNAQKVEVHVEKAPPE